MRLLIATSICILFVAELSSTLATEGSLRFLSVQGDAVFNNATNSTNHTSLPEDLDNILLAEEFDIPTEEDTDSASEPPPVPPNDLCTNAQGPLTVATRPPPGMPPLLAVSGTNLGATSPTSTLDDCRYSNRPGVWYYVVGDGSLMTASTCSPETTLDTRLTIFVAGFTQDCNNLTCITFNDDALATTTTVRCPDQPYASRIAFFTDPGRYYYIYVSGFASQTGPFAVSLEGFNDQRAFALPVSVNGDGVAGDTTQSQLSLASELDDCGYSENDYYGEWYRGPKNRIPRGLWYQVTGTGGRLRVDACSQGTQFHVFDSTSGTCLGGGRNADYFENGCFYYEWDSWPGVSYDIAVHALFVDPLFEGNDECRGNNCGGPVAPAPFQLTVKEVSDTVSVGRSSGHEIFD